METLDLDRPEPDNTERVEVSESDVTTDCKDDTAEEIYRPILCRIADMRTECAEVSKENITIQTKDKGSYSFNGHTIEGVLASVRVLFDKHGIGLVPKLVERTYNGTRCDVLVDFKFYSLDDPSDREVISWGGSDTDYGGKGFAKATTNALKEVLKKTFLITDREDRKEEVENIEHLTDDQISAKAAQKAKEETAQTREAWASNLRKSIRTAGTVDDVKALKRENKAVIDELPKVTRDFFEEEFSDRIEILEAL